MFMVVINLYHQLTVGFLSESYGTDCCGLCIIHLFIKTKSLTHACKQA